MLAEIETLVRPELPALSCLGAACFLLLERRAPSETWLQRFVAAVFFARCRLYVASSVCRGFANLPCGRG